MDMKNVVAVFFVIVIILTFTSLVTPELPNNNNALGVLIIIFSLFAILSVVRSRNKRYYPY